MILQVHETARGFLDAALDRLMEDEVLNNLPIGIAISLDEGRRFGEEPPFLLTVSNESGVVATGLRTPPHPLHVFKVSGVGEEAFEPIVAWLKTNSQEFPALVGEAVTAAVFSKRWASEVGAVCSLAKEMRVFRLDEVVEAKRSPGSLRVATEADAGLLCEWTAAFNVAVGESPALDRVRESVASMLKKESVYLWENETGLPVSCVCNARKTVTGEVVNLVYTPKEYRKRGYARSAVAELSRRLLERGARFCCLFTDVTNPTSNKIYQEIGYRPIGRYSLVRFE